MTTTTPSRHATAAEMQARACQRAHDERVHIFAVPGRPGHFTTKSKSVPGERYSLVVSAAGDAACSCKGYAYRGVCKHAQQLLNRLAREAAHVARPGDSISDLYN